MILDAVIAFFVMLFEALCSVAVPCVNLSFALVEMVAGLFVPGFQLGRWERKGRRSSGAAAKVRSAVALIALLAILWLLVSPKVMNRSITLVAEDGHSLPFAALIVHSIHQDDHRRTDRTGKVRVPRFKTKGITVKDPRYVEETWGFEKVGKELVVRRTVLGSSLDSLADQWMKPESDRP